MHYECQFGFHFDHIESVHIDWTEKDALSKAATVIAASSKPSAAGGRPTPPALSESSPTST
ncbi:hypothetical protein GFS60_08069 (plasmid) [Rhodococcus sp. WAY2]|nr:hypothetical protein GFS60_08069 [Rhodococcus sp. WAY2]